MKLYYAKAACSLTVRIIINELNLPCDYVSIDLKSSPKLTQFGEVFSAINPKDSVPVLQTNDGEILTENAVILQYLADTNKAYQLLPSVGEFARYRVLEWLNYITTELHKSFGLLFNPNITEAMRNDIFIPMIKNKLNYVNKQIENKRFLLGANFTLPDAYLFVILSWAVYFKFNMGDWPLLEKYFLQLQARPSIQKSLEEEGLLHTAGTH